MVEPSNEVGTQIQVSKPTFVFMSGLTGGGKGITSLREIPNLYVPSSISTEQALKRGEKSTKEHYQNLAKDITGKSGEAELYLFGHSLGGFEELDILNALLENPNFKSKKVNLVFIATPGFTEKGIAGFVEFGKRFIRIAKNVSLNEQHTAYPLPEKYYAGAIKQNQTGNKDTEIIFHDDVEKRAERRKFFIDSLQPIIIPKVETKESIIEKLNQIDEQISTGLENGVDIEKLMSDRASLLGPIIQSFFRGEHIDDTTHHKVLEQYDELSENKVDKLTYYPQVLLYLARTGINILEGTGKQLKSILDRAKNSGVEVNVSFILLKRDEMIKMPEIDRIRQNLQSADIQNVVSFFTMEQLAHSSMGYYTKPLVDYVKVLEQQISKKA